MNKYLDRTGLDIPEIQGTLIESSLADHAHTVVHFWAEWNNHDRTMAQHLAELRGRFAGRVALFAYDIDQGLAEDLIPLGIANIPALVYFHHGIPGRIRNGVGSPVDLEDWLEAQVSEPF